MDFYRIRGNSPLITSKKYSYIYFISLSDSLIYCSAITGGNLFQGNHEDFLEIIRQPSGPKVCWLPFTDDKEEGHFINMDTHASFNKSLFATGAPNGGNATNLLFWNDYANGGNGGAVDANEMYKLSSLCEPSKQPRSLTIREWIYKTKNLRF